MNDKQQKIVLFFIVMMVITVVIVFANLFAKSAMIRNRIIEQLEVKGVIDSIKFHNRAEYFLINKEWVYFSSCGSELSNKAKPGDSIVKFKMNGLISIFRETDSGNYQQVGLIDCK